MVSPKPSSMIGDGGLTKALWISLRIMSLPACGAYELLNHHFPDSEVTLRSKILCDRLTDPTELINWLFGSHPLAIEDEPSKVRRHHHVHEKSRKPLQEKPRKPQSFVDEYEKGIERIQHQAHFEPSPGDSVEPAKTQVTSYQPQTVSVPEKVSEEIPDLPRSVNDGSGILLGTNAQKTHERKKKRPLTNTVNKTIASDTTTFAPRHTNDTTHESTAPKPNSKEVLQPKKAAFSERKNNSTKRDSPYPQAVKESSVKSTKNKKSPVDPVKDVPGLPKPARSIEGTISKKPSKVDEKKTKFSLPGRTSLNASKNQKSFDFSSLTRTQKSWKNSNKIKNTSQSNPFVKRKSSKVSFQEDKQPLNKPIKDVLGSPQPSRISSNTSHKLNTRTRRSTGRKFSLPPIKEIPGLPKPSKLSSNSRSIHNPKEKSQKVSKKLTKHV